MSYLEVLGEALIIDYNQVVSWSLDIIFTNYGIQMFY